MHLPFRPVLFRLAPLACAAVLLSACGSLSGSAEPSPSANPAAPVLAELSDLQRFAQAEPEDVRLDELARARARLQSRLATACLPDAQEAAAQADWKAIDGGAGALLDQRQALKDVAEAMDRIGAAEATHLALIGELATLYRKSPGSLQAQEATAALGTLTSRLARTTDRLRRSGVAADTGTTLGKDAAALREKTTALSRGSAAGNKPAKGLAKDKLDALARQQATLIDDVGVLQRHLPALAALTESRDKLLAAGERRGRLLRGWMDQPWAGCPKKR